MKEINWKEIGKLFNEDTLTEFAMDIERDILDKVCEEDNENYQFVIPYDKACVQFGVKHNPPNSWNLQDTIRNHLARKFDIRNDEGEIDEIETV